MRSATRALPRWSCAIVLLTWLGSREVRAQGLRWSTTFDSQNAPTDQVRALHAFDDGSGPALYVGGDFHQAGPAANHIARWDGTTWSAVGIGGLGDDPGGWGTVFALASHASPAGRVLVVGGYFVSAGGVPTQSLAQWNGSSWSGVGSLAYGVDGTVFCLADDRPRLFIGGEFRNGTGMPSLRNIAMWDGSNWHGLNGGIGVGDTYPSVSCLAVFDDGHGPALFAGGHFTNAGGVAVRNLAKWSGSAWAPVGVPPQDGVGGVPSSFVVFDDGSGPALYVAGAFQDAGGVPALNIARWDGAQWTPVGTGHSTSISTLAAFDDGTGPGLYAGGFFSPDPEKWDGSRWSSLGSGVGVFNHNSVSALGAFDSLSRGSELYVGGNFTRAGALPTVRVAGWHALTGSVSTFCFGDGTVAACPCGNQGASNHGCESSLGLGGAWLGSTGSQNPDTIVLHAAGEVPAALSMVLQGDDLILSSKSYGDGLRCVGGHLKRLYTRNAVNGRINVPAANDPSISSRSAALGDPIAPGASRYYQVYYRDPNPSYCPAPQGDTFNTTNGLRIVW